VLALAGCGDDPAEVAATDASPEQDAARDQDAAAEEDAAVDPMPGPADDYDRLYDCADEEPCGLSFTGNLEGGENAITHARLRCTIEGLGARAPGRYLHDTDSSFSDSSSSVRHTLIVNEGGSVQYVRSVTIDGVKTIEPAQRCVLQSGEYFASCLAALDTPDTSDGSEPWLCAFGDGERAAESNLGWFESCETETPLVCE
jgi:hypothetical protein